MPWKRQKRFHLVSEAEAEGSTREIFRAVKQALGVPEAPCFFRAYAAHPRLLELYWQAVQRQVESQELFVLSRRLAADAYTRMHNYFHIPDLGAEMARVQFTGRALQELTNVVELYHYANPPVLLLAAAQMQAFEGSAPPHGECTQPAQHPVFAEQPTCVEERDSPAPTRRVYEELKQALAIPFVPAEYLALARWPDFLHAYWNALKPLMYSPLYPESRHGLMESALNLAEELPQSQQLSLLGLEDAGLEEAEITYAVQVAERFVNVLSSQTLNVAMARIALDGGTLQGRATAPVLPSASAAAGRREGSA